MCATHRHIEEVTLRIFFGSIVGCIDHSLKSSNIVWVSKVNDIQGHTVLLESHAKILEVFISSIADWVTHEDDDSLSCCLVLSVLERQLCNLDRSDDVCLSLNLDVSNAVDDCSDFVGLGESEFNSTELLTKF
jgi:hypothetical protein